MTSPLPGFLSRHSASDRIATGAEPRAAGDLVRDAEAIARALPAAPRGSEVVLVCHDRYLFAAAMLACIERELVVALPPNAQPSMVREVRLQANVATVLRKMREQALGSAAASSAATVSAITAMVRGMADSLSGGRCPRWR